MSDNEYLRVIALNKAVELAGFDNVPDVVGTAVRFLAFLEGAHDVPQRIVVNVDTETPEFDDQYWYFESSATGLTRRIRFDAGTSDRAEFLGSDGEWYESSFVCYELHADPYHSLLSRPAESYL